MSTIERLTEVFREVFNDNSIIIDPNTTANDVEGWDSLSHVDLIIAVETTFKIRFRQSELLSFGNVGDMLACIQSKLPR